MWEYAICERVWSMPMDESSLNNFGKDGWELINILKTGDRDTMIQYVFKKPKSKK